MDLTRQSTQTYCEAANLAVNQVLVRSINTTIIGVLPVGGPAVRRSRHPRRGYAQGPGAGPVRRHGGGAYSSIFIATPLLAQFKEREPEMKRLAKRVATRRAKEAGRGSSRGGDPARPPAAVPVGPRRAAGSTSVAVAAESDEAEQGESTASERSKTEPSKTEPSNEELAAEAARTRVTVSSAAPLVPLRPLGDGAAKRSQPQHKPRSQRKSVMGRLAGCHGRAGTSRARRRVPDITPLIASADGFAAAVERPAGDPSPADVDVVFGIEARGFDLRCARRPGARGRLVPGTEAGKLPRADGVCALRPRVRHSRRWPSTRRHPPGARVLMVDDVLATGGTLAAAAGLVDRVGAELVRPAS